MTLATLRACLRSYGHAVDLAAVCGCRSGRRHTHRVPL